MEGKCVSSPKMSQIWEHLRLRAQIKDAQPSALYVVNRKSGALCLVPM